jgi:uncharacterized repeat protein (TIGR01451 family)
MSRTAASGAVCAALLLTAWPAGAGVTPDLSITKTDGQAYYVPGMSLTYTIVVTNTSATTSAAGAAVSDVLPASLTGATWTCAASAGSSCAASGTGNISNTVNLLAGGTATYTLTASVAPAATGPLVNTATVTLAGDPNSANNSATDVDLAGADLSITKTDDQAYYIAGQTLAYTIVVTNTTGSVAVAGAQVNDTVPASLTGATWTCAASAGSSCAASGTGDIADSVNLLGFGTATYTLTATVSPSATGDLVNTATVSAVEDPATTNNTATDTDPAQSGLSLEYYTVPPCRLMDTRGNGAPIQGPSLVAGVSREATLPPLCGISTEAVSVSLNVVVVSPTSMGYVRMQPVGAPPPVTSTVNFSAGQTRANNLIVGLSPAGQVGITLSHGTADLVVDVNGYFRVAP